MLLYGIPNLNNDQTTMAAVKCLLNKVGENTFDYNIKDVYHMKQRDDKPPPLVVKFTTQQQKITVIQLAKTKTITGTDIGVSSNKRIKVMEHLTQNNIILLHAANQLRS